MTVPYMRDLIDSYYIALLNEGAKKNAPKDDTIDYYDSKKQMSDKERLKKMVPIEQGGDGQNPVDSASLGKDSENKATPEFTDGPKLRKIDQLKKSIEVLQRIGHEADLALNAKDSKAIDKIIDDMNKEIDELSDTLVDNH